MARTKSTRSEVSDRLAQLGKVAGKMEAWRPGTEVLTRVTSQKTIFPAINRDTQVGGWPNQRIALIHGPSGHGKTSLLHGIGLSYLMGGHFYLFVDAEYTSPEDWLRKLMAQHADHPGFRALRPTSYEQTTEAVRDAAHAIVDAKKAGDLPPDVACFIVIDSIRKLVPEKLMKALEKDEGGIDGMSGRAAMAKAALNAQWLDELVPLAHHSNLSVAIIAREMEKAATQPWEDNFKVAGGQALVFESSIVARVTRSNYVYRGEGKDRVALGERHDVRITKTKVSASDGRSIDSFFHTSNGKLVPEGFDRARDVVELGKRLAVLETRGSSIMYGDVKLGQGDHQAVKRLTEDQDLFDEIESKLMPGEGEVV